MMKKIIALFLGVTTLGFFTASCFHQPIKFDPQPDLSVDMTTPVILFSVASITAVTMALVINAHRYVKLTPEGEKVIVFMHEEAPEGAIYIGEVQSKSLPNLLSVKNNLRNKAAQKGGNLLVIDTIQPDIFEGRTFGYCGYGRVYCIR